MDQPTLHELVIKTVLSPLSVLAITTFLFCYIANILFRSLRHKKVFPVFGDKNDPASFRDVIRDAYKKVMVRTTLRF